MRLFENLSVEEFYASISDPNFITELYIEGLSNQNAIMAVTAQNELIKRGEVDQVTSVLRDAINEDIFSSDTSFTQLVATSLIEARRNDPLLYRIGRMLLEQTTEEGEEEKMAEDVEKSVLIGVIRKLVMKHGYTDAEFYQMVDDIFNAE